MNDIQKELQNDIEKKLMRKLTDKEKEFVSWMANMSRESTEVVTL